MRTMVSWMKIVGCLFIDVICFNDMVAARVERHMNIFFSLFSLSLLLTRPHGTAPSESGFCQRFTVRLSCSAVEECLLKVSHFTHALLPSQSLSCRVTAYYTTVTSGPVIRLAENADI